MVRLINLEKPSPPSEDRRWKIIDRTMRSYGYAPHSLIQTLHTVQETFGFLDEEAMRYVAEALRVPLSQVYGVATFYHFFTLKPPGEHTCTVCTGTACYIKGAEDLLRAVKQVTGADPGETSGDKYVICNADEGDPGAYMDRSVMESNPHQMLEGMVIGGYAVGATHGFIYVRAEYPLAIERLKTAIKQAEKKGMLGRNIGGTTFSFDIELRYGAGAFVTGEETALIASVEGQRGLPRPRPPYPAERGLWGKPTLINNVETFANIPPIIRNGGDWFASIGTEKSKGTKVLSLVGRINSVGLIEVPLGITLREIIYDLGGGIPEGRKFKAVQTGGPSGGCIPEEHLDLPVDYESLMQAGSIMGSGGMIVMDETSCMVDVAKYFMDFCKSEACGKCIPCRVGTVQMHHILEKITNGTATTADLPMLEELCDLAKHASLCGLGQSAPNPVLSTLRYFRDEYITHIEERRCPAGVCKFKDAGSFREAVEVKR